MGMATLQRQVLIACGNTPAMFQLYTPRDLDVTASLIARAEAAGLKSIVITLDIWVTGVALTRSKHGEFASSAWACDIDPQAWLGDLLAHLADMPQNGLHLLLFWNWRTPNVLLDSA